MRRSRRLWPRLVASGCLVYPRHPADDARPRREWGGSQPVTGQPLVFDQIVGQPMGLPHLPPQGAWGEVINVTSRWIVIQNHTGQQYPDRRGRHRGIPGPMAHQPRHPDQQASVIEAIGQDLGNNVLQTDHVDVFEGGDRTLVPPTYNSLLPNNSLVTTIDPGFNRFMSPWDYGGQNMLYGWAYPVSGGHDRHSLTPACRRQRDQPIAAPARHPGQQHRHRDTLPARASALTQVTRGNIAHVRKGDYAFMMPQQIGQRGLILSQFVLYKTIPFRQFNPAAIR